MPYDEGSERIVSARRRGTLHPAEIVKMVAPAPSGDGAPPDQPAGDFVEHDLDSSGRLVPVQRPLATNPAGMVVGVVRNYTERYPEGMRRVALLGDPTKSLGSLAEPECRRIIAALDLAEESGGAAGVVRDLGRREDRDGQRHREHGLDRRRACGGSSNTRRAAASSTS